MPIKLRVVREVFDVHFDNFSYIEQLVFYEAYDVERVSLRHAVRQLVVRPQSLSAEELGRITPALLSRIIAMREDYLRSITKPFSSWKTTATADALADGWVKDG